MKYEIRMLSFGKSWEKALNLYLENFLPLFIIALICAFPLILFEQPVQVEGSDLPLETAVLDLFTWFAVQMGIGILSAALLIEYISKKYVKMHQTTGQYIQNALRFIPHIIQLAVFQSVIVGLGFMALFVPGVFLALALSLAVEVLIIEGKGVIESMKRSFFLTQGKKLEIFLFTLILALVSLVIEKILDFILSIVDLSQMIVAMDSVTLLLTQALLAPLGACVFIIIYFNIRIEKEGFDLKQSMYNDDPSQSALQNGDL